MWAHMALNCLPGFSLIIDMFLIAGFQSFWICQVSLKKTEDKIRRWFFLVGIRWIEILESWKLSTTVRDNHKILLHNIILVQPKSCLMIWRFDLHKAKLPQKLCHPPTLKCAQTSWLHMVCLIKPQLSWGLFKKGQPFLNLDLYFCRVFLAKQQALSKGLKFIQNFILDKQTILMKFKVEKMMVDEL